MPLQNRVTPHGDIISSSARGAWLGNRGVIHNADQQIVRPFRLKAWITCMLQFRGRHREVMVPNRWTELFFMDEATAFSAGHRPCFQCRYADFMRFKAAWLNGNPQYGFTDKTSINAIDKILQQGRINSQGNKVTYAAPANMLPDGVFIQVADQPYLIAGGLMCRWTPAGYKVGEELPTAEMVTVLTPASIVNAFGAGYVPQIGL